MEKQVMLSIVGSKAVGEMEDVVELITEGRYYTEGDAYILEYEESELSGMEGTKTTLRIEKDSVVMKREGAFNSHFEFKNNHFFQGNYQTVAGIVQVGMFPTYLDYKFGEDEGRLDLEYRMELAGVETMNQIFLSFKSIEN